MPEPLLHSVKFIDYLQGLADRGDRGALAALRRGLSGNPGSIAGTYPYVVPWLPENRSSDLENAFFLVASLFATYPEHRPALTLGGNNLGQSFASLRTGRLQKNAGLGSIDKRFVALLASPSEDLPEHMRHAVSLLKADDIAVDYVQLLKDIMRWNREDRSVQRAWARSFWRETASSETQSESEPEPGASISTKKE